MRDYCFNKRKLIISIVYFAVILGVMVYLLFIQDVDDATDANFPKIMIVGGIVGFTWLYNELRWMLRYRKNRKELFRGLPFFEKDEPDLNVYCFNFYVCLVMTAIIPVVMIIKTWF